MITFKLTVSHFYAGASTCQFQVRSGFNICNICKYGVCSLEDGTMCLHWGRLHLVSECSMISIPRTILRVRDSEAKSFMIVKILLSLCLCNRTSQYVARRASYTLTVCMCSFTGLGLYTYIDIPM
jgi:hypothetical protein